MTKMLLKVKKATAGRPCVYCGEPGTTLDHVVPLYRGGTHSFANCVPCCFECNQKKGSASVDEFRRSSYWRGRGSFADEQALMLAVAAAQIENLARARCGR